MMQTCVETEVDYEFVKNWAKLSVESMLERLDRYTQYFTISPEHLRLMADSFEHELILGLECNDNHPNVWIPSQCSFKMLDSCVDSLPCGKEKGVFYALDFGGSNFRTVRTELKGNSKITTSQKRVPLQSAPCPKPRGLLDPAATATDMFSFFSNAAKEFMIQEKDYTENLNKGVIIPTGFTFSFPCLQRRLNSATLIEWTKTFETGRHTKDPVEGLDVAELMNVACERNSVPLRIAAILNDTIGTLLSCSYEMDRSKHPPCLIGLILGTGVNACYYEKEAHDYKYKGKIINLECGNFNRDLPITNVDYEVDFAELSNRGKQRLEKMVSGAYLGEICRRAIVKVLQDKAPLKAWRPFAFTSEFASLIIEDTSPDYAATADIIKNIWGSKLSNEEYLVIRRMCTIIFSRSAALSAVIIAGTARRTQYLQPAMGGVSVGIDGSLYKCVPFFKKELETHLAEILGAATAKLVHLLPANDGSGKGAAVAAAMLPED